METDKILSSCFLWRLLGPMWVSTENSSAGTEDGEGSPGSFIQSQPVIKASILETYTGLLFLVIPDIPAIKKTSRLFVFI